MVRGAAILCGLLLLEACSRMLILSPALEGEKINIRPATAICSTDTDCDGIDRAAANIDRSEWE